MDDPGESRRSFSVNGIAMPHSLCEIGGFSSANQESALETTFRRSDDIWSHCGKSRIRREQNSPPLNSNSDLLYNFRQFPGEEEG